MTGTHGGTTHRCSTGAFLSPAMVYRIELCGGWRAFCQQDLEHERAPPPYSSLLVPLFVVDDQVASHGGICNTYQRTLISSRCAISIAWF